MLTIVMRVTDQARKRASLKCMLAQVDEGTVPVIIHVWSVRSVAGSSAGVWSWLAAGLRG